MKRAAVRPVSEGVDAVAAGMQAGGGVPSSSLVSSRSVVTCLLCAD